MISYKNLSVIGTSHIAIESIEEVKRAIVIHKPQIVAIELDKNRFVSLLSKKRPKPGIRMIFELGVGGFLFNLIGAWAEKKMGKMVGVSPGDEMKAAIALAAEQKATIALIDQDIRVTIKHLFQYLTWKEKSRFLADIFMGLFFRKGVIKFDPRKVPTQQLIHKMILQVKGRYPSFYKALIEERNDYMAKNLYNLMLKNNDKEIIAVIGAGHEKEIIGLVKGYEGRK